MAPTIYENAVTLSLCFHIGLFISLYIFPQMSDKANAALPPSTGLLSNYTIHTVPQLHYVIEASTWASFYYTNFSWRELKSVAVDNFKVFLVETKQWAFISHYFFNRGYRILAQVRGSNSFVLLYAAENTPAGERKAWQHWSNIEDALERYHVTGRPSQIIQPRVWGYYQQPTAVIKGSHSLQGEITAEFYQTIYYGTIRSRGPHQKISTFFTNASCRHSDLYVGVAQCAISSARFLSRTAPTVQKTENILPTRVNYINEMDLEVFARYLKESNVDQCYTSYLRYLTSSIRSLEDRTFMVSEEDANAIQEVLFTTVYDECGKELKVLQDSDRKSALKEITEKLQTPPENQNKDILLFIHGFNNTIEDSFLCASNIACDIGFSGRLAVFSWPSQGTGETKNLFKIAKSYFQDTMYNVDNAIPKFLNFLTAICECARKVHIIAHSKGALLVSKTGITAEFQLCKGKIGQVILAHGDVPVHYFEQIYDRKRGADLKSVVDNITVYYQPKDWALFLSCRIGGSTIGEQCSDKLQNESNLDNINISKVPQADNEDDFLQHGTFMKHPMVIEDMGELIHRGTRAHQRKHIQVSCKCSSAPTNGVHVDKVPRFTTCDHTYCYELGYDP